MCISAANYIINTVNKFNATGEWNVRLTSKRLQKLLYFADVLYMNNNQGDSMLDEDFYAWPSGPVIPKIYEIFVRYQEGFMKPFEEDRHNNLTASMKACIMTALKCTKDISTPNLVTASHVDDGPWNQVVGQDEKNYNKKILKTEIYNFYNKKENLPDFLSVAA